MPTLAGHGWPAPRAGRDAGAPLGGVPQARSAWPPPPPRCPGEWQYPVDWGSDASAGGAGGASPRRVPTAPEGLQGGFPLARPQRGRWGRRPGRAGAPWRRRRTRRRGPGWGKAFRGRGRRSGPIGDGQGCPYPGRGPYLLERRTVVVMLGGASACVSGGSGGHTPRCGRGSPPAQEAAIGRPTSEPALVAGELQGGPGGLPPGGCRRRRQPGSSLLPSGSRDVVTHWG